MIVSRLARAFVVAILLLATAAVAQEKSSWIDVERIVAIGDVHGDYKQFRRVLRDAGLINKRNKWTGGRTHLVQLGDVPDRGPDTRKAIDLLIRLEKQARRKGGYVHALIGNHEAMNMHGDLRYVHPGEYQAFANRHSVTLQNAYFKASVRHIRETFPEEEWPAFDEAYEHTFRTRFPLGYVEHRRAWGPQGEYGQWVTRHNTIIRINDTLFVHGGLSGQYAALSLAQINSQVRQELTQPPLSDADAMVDDSLGPLWYRGLALNNDDMPAEQERVLALLSARGAQRIVIAHTPLTGAIVPRFDARVLAVDVGLSAFYGGRLACLVIEGESIYALHRGVRIDLPLNNAQRQAYLEKAADLDPEPSPVRAYLKKLATPSPEQATASPD